MRVPLQEDARAGAARTLRASCKVVAVSLDPKKLQPAPSISASLQAFCPAGDFGVLDQKDPTRARDNAPRGHPITNELGNLKIALRGGGGGVTWTPPKEGGGVGEMGFRVGPFVLCKNGCWRQRHRNTKFGPEKLFPPIIPPPPPPTFE